MQKYMRLKEMKYRNMKQDNNVGIYNKLSDCMFTQDLRFLLTLCHPIYGVFIDREYNDLYFVRPAIGGELLIQVE